MMEIWNKPDWKKIIQMMINLTWMTLGTMFISSVVLGVDYKYSGVNDNLEKFFSFATSFPPAELAVGFLFGSISLFLMLMYISDRSWFINQNHIVLFFIIAASGAAVKTMYPTAYWYDVIQLFVYPITVSGICKKTVIRCAKINIVYAVSSYLNASAVEVKFRDMTNAEYSFFHESAVQSIISYFSILLILFLFYLYSAQERR